MYEDRKYTSSTRTTICSQVYVSIYTLGIQSPFISHWPHIGEHNQHA